MTDKQIEHIARVCWEANRAYCETIGDKPLPPWESAPEASVKSSVDGVRFRLDNPEAPASAQHNAWMRARTAAGWTYGETKDEEKKTHPNLVSFDDLPEHQKKKDFLFTAIVKTLS